MFGILKKVHENGFVSNEKFQRKRFLEVEDSVMIS